jgi:hypothetical protein
MPGTVAITDPAAIPKKPAATLRRKACAIPTEFSPAASQTCSIGLNGPVAPLAPRP